MVEEDGGGKRLGCFLSHPEKKGEEG